MAKKEVKTDLWVYELLKEADIKLDPQGCSIKEINEALKSASKNGSGNVGFPEYCGVIKDYVIVIEDKSSLEKSIKLSDGVIDMSSSAIKDHAVNGAWFYAKHIIDNTTYKKAFAFGVAGNEKQHSIIPIYVDDSETYRILPELESFITFSEPNIDEYYTHLVLDEETNEEKTTEEILKDAANLHEYLRNYGNLGDKEKPLIVAGLLLALREREFKGFSIDDLTGDKVTTDGDKIMQAIESNLKRSNVSPETKKDKLLSQFSLIRDNPILNENNVTLGETPLKYYAKYLDEHIYKSIRYAQSGEDYLGRFYGEFMSYSGGDGQTLGIVLTPKHITELFCDLVDLQPTDTVLDPTCGTGGYLIAAMHRMLNMENANKSAIKKKQLHGYELQPYMFSIATTNMILRGDGKSNLICDDFLKQNSSQIQLKQATVGFMNPPYSMGNKKDPALYEINFTRHLLDSLVSGARCVVIVPQSSMTGKTVDEQNIMTSILKKHTLEGVITLSKDTFYGIGVMPCIAVFTAYEPHPKNKICKFVNFENDGYAVRKHVGLLETETAKDKRQHLLDVWFDRIEAPTSFVVKTTIEPDDEWLHSFYYFNDEIPTELDFEKTIGNYLTFEFDMIMKGKAYLFEENNGI